LFSINQIFCKKKPHLTAVLLLSCYCPQAASNRRIRSTLMAQNKKVHKKTIIRYYNTQ